MIRIVLKLDDQMSGGLNSATSGLEKMGTTMRNIGAGMTAAITAPLVAIGAAGVKMSMELETAMTNVQSITKQSDAEIEALRQTFLDMSMDITKTTDTAQNLSLAFYDIVGSGFEANDAMLVLEASTMAATAGLTETGVAVTGITAVINAYGMEAKDAAHVSDLMFETVNRGVGTFEQLASSISTVAGTAAIMGVTFEEQSAAVATMSKQGISFNEATTALNQTLLAFLSPSEAMTAALSELGYASGQAMVDALGFGGAMEALSKHVDNDATAMAELFGNVRALKGALALTGQNATMFAEDLTAMSNANGAAAAAFAIQTQSFESTLKNFQNTWGVMLIEIGDAIKPVLTAIMQFLTPLMQAFIDLPGPVKTTIVALLALLAAIGPILLIVGQLIMAWTAVSGALAAVGGIAGIATAAMGALGTAFTILTGPIGIAIAAVAALVLAWKTNFLGLRDFLVSVMRAIAILFTGDFKHLGGGGFGEDSWIAEKLFAMHEAIMWFWDIIRNPIASITKLLYMFVTGDFKGLGFGSSGVSEDNPIVSFVLGLREKLLNFASDFNTFKDKFFQLGAMIITGFVNGIKSKLGELWNTVKDMAGKVTNAIKGALKIKSPSQVMLKLGEQVVAGFNAGIDMMGGIGVQVPALAGAGASVSSAPSTGGGIGGGFVVQGDVNITVPVGTTEEQVRHIMSEIGRQVKRRGGQG